MRVESGRDYFILFPDTDEEQALVNNFEAALKYGWLFNPDMYKIAAICTTIVIGPKVNREFLEIGIRETYPHERRSWRLKIWRKIGRPRQWVKSLF